MNPSPPGWPRISSAIFYQDAAAAIDWLCAAFGFEVRLRVEGEGGSIVHSELTYGDGLIMFGSTGDHDGRSFPSASPRSLGGANTQSLFLYVDDVVAHCETARAAGAKILDEPEMHDYGEEWWTDRTYRAEDLEGHQWWIAQRMRTPESHVR